MPDRDAMDNQVVEKEAAEKEAVEKEDIVDEEAPEESSELDTLQEELQAAQAEAEEYLDGWRRAQAEFANYKKRQRAEQKRIQEFANADLIRKLLPVLDDFDRAMATMPAPLHKLSWSEGLLMVRHKLDVILQSEGVEPIETEGEAFDPHYHEAVTHEELEGYDEGDIIGEVQRGYVLGERVLRPALVRVAKAPPVPPGEQEDTPDEESAVIDG